MRPIRLSRTQQQALTREQLLKAAENVFSRFGYGGASVDVIAAEAGFSKGAIYSNFPNKESVFLELLSLYMERDMAELEKIVQLEPKELFKAVNEWLMTTHSDSDCPLLAVELQLHARRSPEFAEAFYALQDRQTQTLARILRIYFEASSTEPPIDLLDLARTLIALAHGLSLQRPEVKSGAPSDAGRIINDLLDRLTNR